MSSNGSPRLAVVAVIAAVIGFLVGRRSAPPAGPAPATMAQRGTGASPAQSSSNPSLVRDLAGRLDRETDPLKRFGMALDHMEAWVAADPESALSWLLRQPVTARRNEVIRLALMQRAETDPAGAAQWGLDHLNGTERANMLIRVAEAWARVDPTSAARWFMALPADGPRIGPLEGLFFRWATDDPRAARSFLDSELSSDPKSATFLQAVLAGWAKLDPPGAAAAGLEAARQHQQPDLFAITLANWAAVDVSSSSQWLLEHTQAGPERNAAVAELAAMFAHQDPPSGTAWIDRLDASEQPAARDHLAAAWATSDPASAARWISSRASDPWQPDTLAAVLTGFLSDDPVAYGTWRDALPEGPLKAKAVELGNLPEDDG